MKVKTKRFRLLIAYDGTDYQGWQSQPGGRTVQDTIEVALNKILKQKTRLHGASRTDSGVHAWGQVAHFQAAWPHSTVALRKALQSQLPPSIYLRQLSVAPASFHARYSARGKKYIYRLKTTPTHPFEARTVAQVRYTIDKMLLNKAIRLYIGRHNFISFAANVSDEETPIKKITRATVKRVGPYLTITIVGSGFMYKMVRSMVGAALEVARGKIPLSRISELLDTPRRTHEVITAPAHGLRLEKVFYK